MVSVSVSIFETQNYIPILKVSVSVSKIETVYTESQSQSQHTETHFSALLNCKTIAKSLITGYK